MNRQEARKLVLGVLTVALVISLLEFGGRALADAWARGDLYPDHVHYYSISGTVSQQNGQPFPGVLVNDNQGHSTTTDGGGNYVLSGLPAGPYSVWASKGGYAFSPRPLTVTLPPSAAGQNFVGIPKRPVIVIPGTGGSANWPCFLFELTCGDMSAWGWTPTANDYYQALLSHLTAAGYTENNSHLSLFFYDWRRPPAENAGKLRDKINQVRAATQSPTVDLVAHSQGGLVARAYIQGSSYGGDVAHLITLGTPHKGIPYLYAHWEAGEYYNVGWVERLGLDILTRRWITPGVVPRVFSVRAILPSMQQMLPTFDYLYDEEHGDRVKPEVQMKQRNTFLPALNANLDTLFNRTDVSTFASTNVSTPMRFYVHGWQWWNSYTWWPNWDDGTPNWGRELQFRSNEGDNTVPLASATLRSPAHVQTFSGVKHGDLPNSQDVADAVLNTLGISHPAMVAFAPETEAANSLIVLVMDGPAEATVTDPQNRTVGPGGTSIPGAEYVSNAGDPFKLILIPAPADGSFRINVQGVGSGEYELGLLDTFSTPPLLISDPASEWDSPKSQIEPGANVTYALTYAAGTSQAIDLMAETPMIQVPVWSVASKVQGRARPGQGVEIRDADSQALLGSGVVAADGRFEVGLSHTLKYGQRIYPLSVGVGGVAVTVDRKATFLPAINRN